MTFSRKTIASVAIAAFVVGSGVIMYMGRPVMQLQNGNQAANQNTNASSIDGAYTMAEVASHNTPASCWATINGNVYDLTTWISRHPGGPDKIIGLCGTDGTAKFTKKHGTFQPAIQALALLKIGTLK